MTNANIKYLVSEWEDWILLIERSLLHRLYDLVLFGRPPNNLSQFGQHL